MYREARLDILQDESNTNRDIPTYEGIEKKVAELTGVTYITHDMCPNTCMAYTGPFKDLDVCSYCGITRYDPKTRKARQHLSTMPLGQQILPQWKDPANAKLMEHRWSETLKIVEQLKTSGGCIDEYSEYLPRPRLHCPSASSLSSRAKRSFSASRWGNPVMSSP